MRWSHFQQTLIWIVIFVFGVTITPAQTFAAVYGDGVYGAGVYNVGQRTQPTFSGDSNNPIKISAPHGCSNPKPSSAPDLFQISPQKNGVTLYFSPSSGNVDRYFVSYGTTSTAQGHGLEIMGGNKGVISVTVSALTPKTTYYFKVRGGNGCQPGDWSNVLAFKVGQALPVYKASSLTKVVTTTIAEKVKPSSVQKVQTDASQFTATPQVLSATTSQPEPSLEPKAPVAVPQRSFIGKLKDFLGNLFKR